MLALPDNFDRMTDKELAHGLIITKAEQATWLQPTDDVITELEAIRRLIDIGTRSISLAIRRMQRINDLELYKKATDQEGNLLVREDGSPMFTDFRAFFDYYADVHKIPRSTFFKGQGAFRRIDQLGVDEETALAVQPVTLHTVLDKATTKKREAETGEIVYEWQERFVQAATDRGMQPEELMNEVLQAKSPTQTYKAFVPEPDAPVAVEIYYEEDAPEWVRLDVIINGRRYIQTMSGVDHEYMKALAGLLKVVPQEGVLFPEQYGESIDQ